MKALKLTLLNLREVLLIQWHNFVQLLIGVDQLLRVLLAMLLFRKGWADETLSSYCWRLYAAKKWAGLVLMPLIDAMFAWQKPDPAYLDENGQPIKSHCRRAFEKERAKSYLPPQYRA